MFDRGLKRKPFLVCLVPMMMMLSGASPLLGGILVEPHTFPPLGLVSLGENLDPLWVMQQQHLRVVTHHCLPVVAHVIQTPTKV
jgi:hypothetical protein